MIWSKGAYSYYPCHDGCTRQSRCSIQSEDVDQIGDGMVSLLGLAKSLTDPKILTFLQKAVEIPATVDLSASKKVGPWGLLSAGSNDEVKEGLGVLIELTKALSKLKGNGDIAASVEKQGGIEKR